MASFLLLLADTLTAQPENHSFISHACVRVCGKAMRSVNIIEFSIKNRVEMNISRKYSSNYHAIFFVHSNVSKMNVFRIALVCVCVSHNFILFFYNISADELLLRFYFPLSFYLLLLLLLMEANHKDE
jgi:hypothetical protein